MLFYYYRKNFVYFKEYLYFSKDDDDEEGGEVVVVDSDDDRFECFYGMSCYRWNLQYKWDFKYIEILGELLFDIICYCVYIYIYNLLNGFVSV